MKILNVQGLTNVKYTELQEEVMEKTILSSDTQKNVDKEIQMEEESGIRQRCTVPQEGFKLVTCYKSRELKE